MIIFAIVTGVILAALIAGVIALFRAGIAREESERSLLGAPPSRTAWMTRRVVGLYVRAPRHVIENTDLRVAPRTEHLSAEHPCAMGEER